MRFHSQLQEYLIIINLSTNFYVHNPTLHRIQLQVALSALDHFFYVINKSNFRSISRIETNSFTENQYSSSPKIEQKIDQVLLTPHETLTCKSIAF